MLKRLALFSLASSAILGGLMLAITRLGLLQGTFARSTILIDLAFTLAFFGMTRLIFAGLQTKKMMPTQEDKPLNDLVRHWKHWISEGLIYFGVVAGSLGIYMIWNKLAFGTASPVSGQIKQWWASLPGRAYGGAVRDILSFLGINYWTDANAWNPVSNIVGYWAEQLYWVRVIDTWRYLTILALFAIAFYLILRLNPERGKGAVTKLAIIPLLSGAWLQMIYYNAPGYASFKEWYWISQLVLIVLTLSLVVGMSYRILIRIKYAHLLAWLLAAYLGGNMGASFWRNIQNSMPYNYWSPDAPFMDVGPLLEENTEPGSIIGITGGGNVGYFIQDRTVANMDGLINSYPYFQALQSGQAGAFFAEMGLDYVLANPNILDQQPYRGQFNEYLHHLNIYYGGKELMRYGLP